MARQRRSEFTSKERKGLPAKQAFNSGRSKSRTRAVDTYGAPRSTVKDRINGVPSRGDCRPNSSIFTETEELALVQHVLEADARGYQLTYDLLREAVDKLLRDRDTPPVGKNWLRRFVDRVPELKLRVNRKHDYKRAFMEDPKPIREWFELMKDVIVEYGIVDSKIYNFDEVGFQMGVISSRAVITGAERRQAPKSIQPGNTEWVTGIVDASSTGWSLEVAKLRRLNETLTARKQRKKKIYRGTSTRSVADGLQLANPEAEADCSQSKCGEYGVVAAPAAALRSLPRARTSNLDLAKCLR